MEPPAAKGAVSALVLLMLRLAPVALDVVDTPGGMARLSETIRCSEDFRGCWLVGAERSAPAGVPEIGTNGPDDPVYICPKGVSGRESEECAGAVGEDAMIAPVFDVRNAEKIGETGLGG